MASYRLVAANEARGGASVRFQTAPGELEDPEELNRSRAESPIHDGAHTMPMPGEVISEADTWQPFADEQVLLQRSQRSKSCLKSDFDPENRSASRKSRLDSRGVVIDSESRKHKVLFVDDVHQDAPIEEVKEVASVKNKSSGKLSLERQAEVKSVSIFFQRFNKVIVAAPLCDKA
eukprot:s128_g9.t1